MGEQKSLYEIVDDLKHLREVFATRKEVDCDHLLVRLVSILEHQLDMAEHLLQMQQEIKELRRRSF